jgi:hypothetical protein
MLTLSNSMTMTANLHRHPAACSWLAGRPLIFLEGAAPFLSVRDRMTTAREIYQAKIANNRRFKEAPRRKQGIVIVGAKPTGQQIEPDE